MGWKQPDPHLYTTDCLLFNEIVPQGLLIIKMILLSRAETQFIIFLSWCLSGAQGGDENYNKCHKGVYMGDEYNLCQ